MGGNSYFTDPRTDYAFVATSIQTRRPGSYFKSEWSPWDDPSVAMYLTSADYSYGLEADLPTRQAAIIETSQETISKPILQDSLRSSHYGLW